MKNTQKIDHVAIAVTDLQKAIEVYDNILNQQPSHIEEIADQQVKAAFYECGDAHLELLQGIADTSPITRFINKNGPGIHHICIQVTDLKEQLQRLKTLGVRLIDQTPRTGAMGKQIAFIHPAAACGVLIELVEKTS